MRNNNASLDKKKARMAEAFLSRSPAAASECAKSAGAGWLQLRGGGGGGGRTWRTTRASLTPRYLPPRDSTPSADRGLGGGDGEGRRVRASNRKEDCRGRPRQECGGGRDDGYSVDAR
jgi:hypothetical protein